MTFSINKIGTINDVTKHLMEHELEGRKAPLRVETYNKAKRAATLEVAEFSNRGHTHVAISITGSAFSQENGNEDVGYQIRVLGFDKAHYKKIYSNGEK